MTDSGRLILKLNFHLRIVLLALAVTFVISEEIAETVSENEIIDADEESVTTENVELAATTESNMLDSNVHVNKTTSVKTEKPFLLPHAVKPLHYKLEIIPLLFPVEDVKSPYFNMTRFSAPGKVWIQFKCLQETNNITIHASQDMEIENDQIQVKKIETNEVLLIKNVTRDNETDFLVLHLFKSIGKEDESNHIYTLFIEFTAKIADDRLNGMYLDYYVDPSSKEKRYLSTTLFAPNHARKAFPCFDEPGLKANFSISIGRKDGSGYSSISNMPLANIKTIPDLDGWVWDEFDTTPPLPTYLIALITTDFGFRSINDGDLLLKLHAPDYLLKRIKTVNASLANDSMAKSPYLLQDPLHFIAAALKMWKGTKLGLYPLPKVDIVALPHFYFNAMENMGAITFKYPVILNVENVTTTSELVRLSFVAGHEIVHQWFGNMMTPKSWTYVWLKESFSDLFARRFLSESLNAGYKHDDFVNSELQRAMRFDGGSETHPLENHVTTASAVGEIYTDIPYRKGAAIMNMARHFLSDSVIQDGLESLFLEKKYSNIDQNDLFNYLEKSQKKYDILKSQGLDENITLSNILNEWTKQHGYPVIRVRREGSKLFLRQEKYKNSLLTLLKTNENETIMESDEENLRVNSSTQVAKTVDEFWWIPVPLYKYTGFSNKRRHSIYWLRPHKEESKVDLGEFYSITNVEGYFRILYGKSELYIILKDLMRKSLTGKFGAYVNSEETQSLQALERSQLLDDYFTFAFSKYEDVPISLLFHILSVVLPHEEELVVWNTFFQNIQKPYKLFQSTKYFPILQKYLQELLRPLHAFLYSQKSTVFSVPCFHSSVLSKRMYFSQFSSTVFSRLCAIDHLICGDIAKKAVQKFMESEDVSTTPADDQETLYCAANKYASNEDADTFWNFFEKMYFQEYFSVQRDRYLKATSCTLNRDYLLRLLSWTTNDTMDFHDIDRVTLLKYVIANPIGREIMLDFIDANFDALYKSASVANPVTEALKALVEYVNTEDKLEELENFVSKHKDAMEKKKKFLEKQIKKAKLNLLWMETFASDVHQSMENYLQSKTANNLPSCSYESIPDFEQYINELTDWT